jgi:hypothetical protein
MKLYVKDIDREPDDTLYTFLFKFLNMETTFKSFTSVATYYDLECKDLQCLFGKHRSFDDIVLVSKTYFKVSDKIVAKTVIKFLNNYQNTCLVLCDFAKKWVLNNNLSKHKDLTYCAKYNKGYSRINDPYDGIYSYNDILTLAGLDIEEEQQNE